MTVRTRIAPSPTGIPHIGTARTALFDYLLAKKYGGQFILRLEDTDQKRLVPEAADVIYKMHQFLGLIPDEGPQQGGEYSPYIQTQRLDIYQEYAQKLLKKGILYEDEGALRIKMPATGRANWKDLVQGKLSYPYAEIDDKVLMKSSGIPTYHLAVVVDDHLMKITHVLRGVEWIASTPVHLLLFEALGWEPPLIGHLPLILGPDKSKLSKRHGAKSVLQYADEGYLPEALNNFLFYLGNSYQDNSALLTLEEMVAVFDETKLQKQNAIFDLKKLDYFNAAWIRRLDVADLRQRLLPFIDFPLEDQLLDQLVPLAQPRLTTLKQFASLTRYFIDRPPAQPELQDAQNQLYLQAARETLTQLTWAKDSLETHLQDLCQQKNFHKGEFFMALRLAVCGQKVTLPLTESMLILGQDETLTRLDQSLSQTP